MKIIFAQGNPGAEFAGSRHNVGFAVLDSFARKLSLDFSDKPKFNSQVASGNIAGEKVLFVKPTTFYNETGPAARALADFYKLDIARDVLIVHDDFALPLGTIRVRTSGSDAGNNGIKSLNAHLGQNYHRLRIGIWNEQRNKINDVDFVLGKFSANEQKTFNDTVTPKAHELIEDFIAEKIEVTSHKLI